MRKHNTTAALILAAVTLLTACKAPRDTTTVTEANPTETVELATMPAFTGQNDSEEETTEVILPPVHTETHITDTEESGSALPAEYEIAGEYVSVTIDHSLIPPYNGTPYVDVTWKDSDLSSFWNLPKGQIVLSPYDQLGRCGSAIVHAVSDLLPTGERGSTGMAKPSGWVQNKYEGIVDSEPPYIYNRAHLLMWAVTGLTDTQENLITGTRYFNMESMLPTELEVVRYIENGGELLYRVTPIFSGDNLLAEGVLMEAVSGDGTFSICRFAYNVQPGIILDYRTGNNWPEGTAETSEENGETQNDGSAVFILNTGTHKFHVPGCESVADIKEKNRQDYTGPREELINMGYDPCKRCNP